jgi:hypothetical protein
MKNPSFFFMLLLLLTACMPQLARGPEVVLINAPSDQRVTGLAEGLEQAVLDQAAPGEISFVRGNAVRFQETHRDMAGSRSPLQAAFIAQALGADFAVTVAAPLYTRTVDEDLGVLGNKRLVHSEVKLAAAIVDPTTAAVLNRFETPTYIFERIESDEKPLVDEADDPDLQAGLKNGLRYLGRPVATELAVLLSRLSSQGHTQ